MTGSGGAEEQKAGIIARRHSRDYITVLRIPDSAFLRACVPSQVIGVQSDGKGDVMELEVEISELEKAHRRRYGRWLHIATAESATAGRIGDRLTNVPGASEYVVGGIIAYSNEAKQLILGVSEYTLGVYGAVSAEVALEMAAGGREALHADLCVSDTGIAGPGGGSLAKPVGLFYLGLAMASKCHVERHVFEADRDGNKEAAVGVALTLVRDRLVQLVASEDQQNG